MFGLRRLWGHAGQRGAGDDGLDAETRRANDAYRAGRGGLFMRQPVVDRWQRRTEDEFKRR
jgi:hypothetical protein